MPVDYVPEESIIFEYDKAPFYYPSASGYGSKIPTRFMLSMPGEKRKRRVYAVCYSNAASFYILLKGLKVFIHDYQFDEPVRED